MSTSDDDRVIRVEELEVGFGDRTVLSGISFDVRRGEILVVLGGSGSGKTTLLRTMVGLERPRSGRVLVDGEDICAMPTWRLRLLRTRLGMCFQGAALFNSMTVSENVGLALREHTDLEESTIDIMTTIKLELVGLAGTGDQLPSELSGGMRKRAGIARAMAMDPEFLFYDEPSAGLDPIVAAGIDELIRDMQGTFGITSVVVTHEMESVRRIADRVCVLYRGEVAGLGTLEEIEASDHPYIQQFLARRPEPGGKGASELAERLAEGR